MSRVKLGNRTVGVSIAGVPQRGVSVKKPGKRTGQQPTPAPTPTPTPPPAFAFSPATAAEEGEARHFQLNVTRYGSAEAFSGTWAVTPRGGAPVNAADFAGALPSGSWTIAANASWTSWPVESSGDSTLEPDEGFTLTAFLNGVAVASIEGTVLNDDAEPGPDPDPDPEPDPEPTPAPVFLTPPSFTPSEGVVGDLFTADPPQANNATSFDLRWLLDAGEGPGEVGGGNAVVAPAEGALVLEVIAHGPGGSTLATSEAVIVGPAPEPEPDPAPVFTEQPSISPASGETGDTFTADPGTATHATGIDLRWLLDATPIGTAATVVPLTAGALVLEATATGPGGETVALSDPVTVTLAPDPDPDPEPGDLPELPEGQAFLTTADGDYLVTADGAYLIGATA